MVARTSTSDRLLVPARSGLSRMAHIPVSSWLRITAPMDAFSPDQAVLLSLPTVTTVLATSTCATPGRSNSRSTSGDPAACSLFSKNNRAPGMHHPAYGELARVGIRKRNLCADADRGFNRPGVRHLRQSSLHRARP